MSKASRAIFASSLIAASAFAWAPQAASADPGGLAGSWSGGGSVTFAGGARERARCRATFSPTSKSSYAVNATCATQSGTVSQTANVHGFGSNYKGTFYNPDFDASGTISVVVHGSSQTVRLISSKGTALLRLSR